MGKERVWEFREDWLNFLSSSGTGDITKKQQTAGERKDLNINKDTLKPQVFMITFTFTNQSPCFQKKYVTKKESTSHKIPIKERKDIREE